MNRIVSCAAMLALFCLVGACSSSRPEITSTTIADSHPVVGQRLLLRVLAQSDNPPLRYVWNGSGGVFQSTDDDFSEGEPSDQYYVYWVPTSATDSTVKCTVIDDEDQEETYHFSFRAEERTLETLVVADLVLMGKDPQALLGGILAGVANQDLTYYASTGTTDFDWGKSYFDWDPNPLSAMMMTSSSSYYYSVSYVWAVYQDAGDWKLVSHGSSDTTAYDTPFLDNGVSAVTKMGVNGTRIWVGTDKGLYAYSTTSEDWIDPADQVDQSINDIYTANGCVYAATEAGIYYSEDNGGTWTKFAATGDTKAITGYYDINLETVTLYALTEETAGGLTYTIRCFNSAGTVLSEPGYPPDSYAWIEGLDTDPLGNLWFGKWKWNAVDGWAYPDVIDDTDDHIVRSLVSPEGLVYLQTTSGVLKVWGKQED